MPPDEQHGDPGLGFGEFEDLVLLAPMGGQDLLIKGEEIRAREDEIDLTLLPGSPEQVARLSSLSTSREPVGIAFGTTGELGIVQSSEQIIDHGTEKWKFKFKRTLDDPAGSMMEMGYQREQKTYSADDLAILRARWILLDERPILSDAKDDFEQTWFESMVQGTRGPLRPKGSPFPSLYAVFGQSAGDLLAVCRLFGVLHLRLSSVIRTVDKLDLVLNGPTLKVSFKGTRDRFYANVPATQVEFIGECQLDIGDGLPPVSA